MINPPDLSDEALINKYFHVRQDFQAYEVSSDRELLPLLKSELLNRMRIKNVEEIVEQLLDWNPPFKDDRAEIKRLYSNLLKQL